ncbi:MAG TPA: anti-sigma factor [Gemmatimonadaceae bacterium]|nr:anti-sigma factor [Gemmatimonadaceae bacterium]
MDRAAAYVLGALDADEARAFEAELARSEALRREVDELREVTALLALGAPSLPRDDERLKARLLERVRSAPRAAGDESRHVGASARPESGVAPQRDSRAPGARAPAPRARDAVRKLGWALAAAALVGVALQEARVRHLARQVATAEQRRDSVAARLAERDTTLGQILAPSTTLIQLTATGQPAPGVQLFWNAASRRVVLHAYGLPPAPTGRVYQLWFLGAGAPIPGGTFNSESNGSAVATMDGPPSGAAFTGAAITQEPAGGSSAPTSPIIVAGTLGE